ncbi:MAG: tetratricopeptide repeat protein [Saprospiraceae bacterium]
MPNALFVKIALSGLFFTSGVLVAAQSDPARQGDRAFADKRYDEARRYWQQAIEQAPERSAALRYNQGAAAYRMDELEEAEAAFKEAAESTLPPSQRADAWYNLGNAQLRQGKYEEAIAAYRNSLKLAPGLNDAKANLQYAKIKREEQRQKSGQGDDHQDQARESNQQEPQSGNPGEQDSQPSPPQPGDDRSTARKGRDELKNIMEGIERADQKAGQKYRSKERNANQTKPEKDW